MKRKGQAALDYLSTYGWALMAMGVALAALYVFLDYKPERLVPETCSLGDSFNCIDFMINRTNSNMTLSIKNEVGLELEMDSLLCMYDGQEYRSAVPDSSLAKIVDPGEIFNLTCNMQGAPLKSKSKVDVTIVYYKKGMSYPSSTDGFATGQTVR